jgi:hypothetical protein
MNCTPERSSTIACLGPRWGSMTSRSRSQVAMSISPRTWMTVAPSTCATSVENCPSTTLKVAVGSAANLRQRPRVTSIDPRSHWSADTLNRPSGLGGWQRRRTDANGQDDAGGDELPRTGSPARRGGGFGGFSWPLGCRPSRTARCVGCPPLIALASPWRDRLVRTIAKLLAGPPGESTRLTRSRKRGSSWSGYVHPRPARMPSDS